ncbi:DUF5677 domain-containing protein [Tellurirhabdus bombi]|uniref:DUF5677 domain-containing protein n=1 Tax=Tellurirhabdus bombi TaxID=2907205 RepID=UPI001F27A06B|nr:DUF5677 domain-containing protein [Tellurirhabdus bombi]
MYKPVEDILPLNEPSGRVKAYLDLCADGIEAVVSYGTHVLKWELENLPKTEADTVAPVLLRHLIEILDSIGACYRNSMIGPSKILARSALETSFSLHYLLKEDTERRALCFKVTELFRKLAVTESYEPGTERFKQLKTTFKNHARLVPDLPESPFVVKEINAIQKEIDLPIYDEVRSEYLRVKNSKKGNEIKWYSLFSKNGSIVDLATVLNKYDFYHVLYKPYSEATHASRLSSEAFLPDENGNAALSQIRSPKSARDHIIFLFHMAIEAYHAMIDKRIPSKKHEHTAWALWFIHNYADRIHKLNRLVKDL